MEKSKKEVVEWQVGRLERGRMREESGEWVWDDAGDLFWYGLNGEVLDAGAFRSQASSTVLEGRTALARICRPLSSKGRVSASYFVEFPDHYLTCILEEDCRNSRIRQRARSEKRSS